MRADGAPAAVASGGWPMPQDLDSRGFEMMLNRTLTTSTKVSITVLWIGGPGRGGVAKSNRHATLET